MGRQAPVGHAVKPGDDPRRAAQMVAAGPIRPDRLL
jgi:hypothetical protein